MVYMPCLGGAIGYLITKMGGGGLKWEQPKFCKKKKSEKSLSAVADHLVKTNNRGFRAQMTNQMMSTKSSFHS